MEYTYLIIGGGIAGTTAADTIRKNDPGGSIVIVSDEPHYLYSRIMLSKPGFFLGKIPFDQIWMKDESWYKKHNIEFLGGKTAIALNPRQKTVSLDDGTTITYGKLLIATGITPCCLPVPGADTEGVFNVRTLEDGKAIIHAVSSVKKAVTIGGGFIGFEMANLFRLAGAGVTMLVRESRFWEPALDPELSAIVEDAIQSSGVTIMKNVEVERICGDERVTGVSLTDGTEVPSDIVVCGIGGTSDTAWLSEAGVATKSPIFVDKYLKTTIPDVWSAGDVAAVDDPILEDVVQLGNWVNAQEQGRVAGMNMTGKNEEFRCVSYYTTHGFDISVSFVGNAQPKQPSETIIRSGGEHLRTQFVTVNGRVVGGILVNEIKTLRSVIELIENKVDISDKRDQLSDPNVDLKTILSV